MVMNEETFHRYRAIEIKHAWRRSWLPSTTSSPTTSIKVRRRRGPIQERLPSLTISSPCMATDGQADRQDSPAPSSFSSSSSPPGDPGPSDEEEKADAQGEGMEVSKEVEGP